MELYTLYLVVGILFAAAGTAYYVVRLYEKLSIEIS